VNVYRCPPSCTSCLLCDPPASAPEPDTFDEACSELDAACDRARAEAVAMMEAEAALAVAS
jgi:hypothetical protein